VEEVGQANSSLPNRFVGWEPVRRDYLFDSRVAACCCPMSSTESIAWFYARGEKYGLGGACCREKGNCLEVSLVVPTLDRIERNLSTRWVGKGSAPWMIRHSSCLVV